MWHVEKTTKWIAYGLHVDSKVCLHKNIFWPQPTKIWSEREGSSIQITIFWLPKYKFCNHCRNSAAIFCCSLCEFGDRMPKPLNLLMVSMTSQMLVNTSMWEMPWETKMLYDKPPAKKWRKALRKTVDAIILFFALFLFFFLEPHLWHYCPFKNRYNMWYRVKKLFSNILNAVSIYYDGLTLSMIGGMGQGIVSKSTNYNSLSTLYGMLLRPILHQAKSLAFSYSCIIFLGIPHQL